MVTARESVKSLAVWSTRSFSRVWLVATILLFGLCCVWSFAVPLNAGNDEGAHVLRAVSVVRGQLLGSDATGAHPNDFRGQPMGRYAIVCALWKQDTGLGNVAAFDDCLHPFTVVTVPRRFVGWPLRECQSGSVADTCPVHLKGPNEPTDAITYVGRYPPLYYSLVGLPSLVSQTDAGVYGMRLISGLLTSVLLGLALAVAATWSRYRLLCLSVAVAASPMVFVFGSIINPNGLEMAAALCTWTGAVLLVIDHHRRPPTGLIVATAAASTVLVLSRPLSPLWFAVIAIFAVALRPASVRTLAADRRVQVSFGCLLIVTLFAVAYVIWAQALSVMPVGKIQPGTSEWTLVMQALGEQRIWFNQFAGGFGWSLTNPPLIGRLLLLVSICSIVIASIRTARRRALTVLVLLTVTAVVLPAVIEVSQVRNVGFDWYARYSYTLYSGVIVVAGAISGMAISKSRNSNNAATRRVRRFFVLVVLCMVGSQLADVLWAIGRYSVDLSRPLDVFRRVPGEFNPPIPFPVLMGSAIAICLIYGWFMLVLCKRPPCRWLTLKGSHVPARLPQRTEGHATIGTAKRSTPHP